MYKVLCGAASGKVSQDIIDLFEADGHPVRNYRRGSIYVPIEIIADPTVLGLL